MIKRKRQLDTSQMVDKLIKCRVGRLAFKKMQQENRVKKIQVNDIKFGYYTDFEEFLLECYNILIRANKKGYKI